MPLTDWTAPSKSFDGTTLSSTAQDGPAIDLRGVMSTHAVQYVFEENSGDIHLVSLQGSLDGTNWYDIGGTVGSLAAATGTVTTTALQEITDKPARYVRAHGSASSGAPVVTAWITSRS